MVARRRRVRDVALPMVLAAALAEPCDAVAKQEIKVPGWPDLSAKVPLSAGILSNDLVLASGMAGVNLTSFKPVPGGVRAETRQALELVREVVEAGGSTMSSVVGCAVYLKDIRDFAAMNEVYATFFPKPRPARVAMEVSALAGEVSVEVQCRAALPSMSRREIVVPGWPDMTSKFPFSTGIVAGEYTILSGSQGIDFKTGKMVEGGVKEQTTKTLSNLLEAAEAAGSSVDRFVDCAVYLTDIRDLGEMDAAYTKFFPTMRPPRVTVQVVALAGTATVEVQCLATLPSAVQREVVVPAWPASSRAHFSNGVVAGSLLFASGLVGLDMRTGDLVPGGVEAETAQALKLLSELLEAGGTTMAEVVECAVYLRDMKDFASMNAAYAAAFPKPAPARVAVQVAALVRGAAIEIKCVAALPDAAQLILY